MGDEVLPITVASKQPQIFLTLKTDAARNFGGFRMEWTIDGCTERLIKPRGMIISPSYGHPEKLSDVTECEWLIEVDFDKSIELTFSKLETTKTRICNECK